jgi:hypothetical protein
MEDGKHPRGDSEGTNRVGRRAYLRLAGSALAGATLASAGASAAESDSSYALLVDARGADQPTDYTFEVSGSVQKAAATTNSGDSVSGSVVEGTIESGVNGYVIEGSVVRLDFAGPASLDFGANVADILPAETRRVVVRSDSEISYEFTTTGAAEKLLNDGKMSAEESNDSVTGNDDGSTTVSGYTGNGYGDAYEFVGEVTDFSPMSGPYTLELDGETVTPYELTGTEKPPQENTISISAEGEVSYEFTTSGEAQKLLDNGKMSAEESNDSVTGNGDGTTTVSGYTGNGYGDSYAFSGEVTDFSPMEGSYTIYLNDQEITAYELTGTEPPEQPDQGDQPADGPLGGGEGYQNAVRRSEAQFHVSTTEELQSAFDQAGSGDVVWVEGDAEIRGEHFRCPGGITLASDRGQNGSPGGVIKRDSKGNYMMEVGDGARITGLRIEGGHPTGHRSNGSWDTKYPITRGLKCTGEVEVDNCELYGWEWTPLHASGFAHVHHCDVHHNYDDGEGYGLQPEADAHIHHCTFNYNRHSIANTGSGDGYLVEDSWFGPEHRTGHILDHHDLDGAERLVVRRCTFEGGSSEALHCRSFTGSIPNGRVVDNWFKDWDGSDDRWGNELAIDFPSHDGDNWSDAGFVVEGNAYGESDPGSDVGHPR